MLPLINKSQLAASFFASICRYAPKTEIFSLLLSGMLRIVSNTKRPWHNSVPVF